MARNSKSLFHFRSYGIAVLAVTIALGLKLLLAPLIEVESPFLLFFAAIIVSAIYGGMRSGIAATILAAFVSDYWFLSPAYSILKHSPGQTFRLLLFVVEGVFISGLIARLTTTQERLALGQIALRQSEAQCRVLMESTNNAYADLEKRVQERTEQLLETNRALQQQIVERQRVEEALQESERRFRAIFNQTFQFIGLMQPDGLLLEANQTALDFGGLQRSEVVDRPFWQAYWWTISRDTQEQLKAAIERAATGEFVRYEVDVLGVDNRVVTIDFSIQPLRDETGQVVLLIPEGRDITDLRQVEQTLRSFFDSASMMMGVVELLEDDIRHITDNATTARFFGTSVQQMQCRLASEMGTPQSHIQEWLQHYRAAEQTQAPVRFEYSHTTTEGQRWLSATVCPIAVKTNQLSRFAYIVEDITDRKQATVRLHEARQALEQLNVELEQRVQERTLQLETTNQQLEQEIYDRQQGEQRFRLAVDNIPDVFVIYDAQRRFQFVNAAGYQRSGLQASQLLGHRDEDCFPPEVTQTYLPTLEQAIVTRISQSIEFTVTLPQAGTYTSIVTYVPLLDSQGNLYQILGITHDVSQQKRIEAELRTRAQQQAVIAYLGQRALSDNDLDTLMSEATCLIAQTLKAEYCKVLELLPDGERLRVRWSVGWQAGLVGQTTISADPGSQAGYTLLAKEPVIVTDLRCETRFKGTSLLHQHGVISGMSVTIAGREQPFGVLGVHSTEQRIFTQDDVYFLQAATNTLAETIQRQQAKEILQHQSEELALANRLKDEFLATLSHELRTPLNAMLGWTQLLPNRPLDATTTTRALDALARNTRSLAQLIEDVLDMSDIITGRLQLRVAPVSLLTVIERAIASIELAAATKHIQIESHLDPLVGLVQGDSTRLQQVVWNLLSNAVKFTPDNGEIQIQLKQIELSSLVETPASSPYFPISLSPHSPVPLLPYAQIVITDTGQGISPGFLPFVFDRFRQEDGSITRLHSGLGLGLAIVRYLVELHGGSIRAASRGIGQGASFTMTLPILADSLLEAETPWRPLNPMTDNRPPILTDIRVLVVVAEADTQELLTVSLQIEGAEVLAVGTMAEELERARSFQPMVLVSDFNWLNSPATLQLPLLDLQASPANRPIPILALIDTPEDTAKAIAAGFEITLLKPFDPLKLIEMIQSLVASA